MYEYLLQATFLLGVIFYCYCLCNLKLYILQSHTQRNWQWFLKEVPPFSVLPAGQYLVMNGHPVQFYMHVITL